MHRKEDKMQEHKSIMEAVTKEGIKTTIGADKRYKDLGEFWYNVEAVRSIPTVVAFEGIEFALLDKLLPVLERELGFEVKTAEIKAAVVRSRGTK